MIEKTIKNWHHIIQTGSPNLLDDLLAEDVVFHSPVMHSPQSGKPLVKMYLSAAFHVLIPNQFTYLREITDGHHAMLEFQAEIEGTTINGVDIITCDSEGKITDFKVMLRPLKAITLVQQKMQELLQQ